MPGARASAPARGGACAPPLVLPLFLASAAQPLRLTRCRRSPLLGVNIDIGL